MTKHDILPHLSVIIPPRGRTGVRLGAQRSLRLLGVFLTLSPVEERRVSLCVGGIPTPIVPVLKDSVIHYAKNA